MKHAPTKDEQLRFRPSLRHYHRSGSRQNRSWEEWIDGETKSVAGGKWLKVTVLAVAVIGLLGILAGLFIELR